MIRPFLMSVVIYFGSKEEHESTRIFTNPHESEKVMGLEDHAGPDDLIHLVFEEHFAHPTPPCPIREDSCRFVSIRVPPFNLRRPLLRRRPARPPARPPRPWWRSASTLCGSRCRRRRPCRSGRRDAWFPRIP